MMKEFFVIKSNGVGMVIDADSEDDVLSQVGYDVISIEESPASKRREKSYDNNSETLKQMYIQSKSTTQLEKHINRVITAVNQSNQVSAWERKFAYGCKRYYEQKQKLTTNQMETFLRLYTKLVR